MIARREYVYPRLEVDFRILAGELNDMEADFKDLTIEEFIKMWVPERRQTRLTLKFVERSHGHEVYLSAMRKPG